MMMDHPSFQDCTVSANQKSERLESAQRSHLKYCMWTLLKYV